VFVVHADSPQYHNVQRKKEAGAPAEKPVLLHHAQTQGYIAIRDNKVVCIPLQSDDPTCTFTFIFSTENNYTVSLIVLT